MRIWVDPDKLATLNLSASDIADALREQNRQVAAGVMGGTGDWTQDTPGFKSLGSVVRYTPAIAKPKGAVHAYPITVLGRLSKPEEFEEIVIRTDGQGRRIRIKDVGRVEMGAKNLDTTSRVDMDPNASLAVWALPDANSIDTAKRVITRLDELKKNFPDDIDYKISLDMTPFMIESINEVEHTLIEAIVLVAIVVLVFLQNWRSAIIPLVAVPVAIVGTFAAMIAIGFSLNILTMFGLVLAVGIVVDDAIVVVEAVEHHIEAGLSPRAAAHKAMGEVSGPVVAVALVLSAVFVPCAFISGITGMFFRQFALTIAVSTVISAFNSLTLSPALAALLLQPRGAKKDWFGRLLDLSLGWFFRGFNWVFLRGTSGYLAAVGVALRGSALVLVIYAVLLGLTWWTSKQLPAGYIPNGDQGRFYVAVQLPDAASMDRTQYAVDRISEIFDPKSKRAKEEFSIVHTTGIAGQSFTLNANGSNFGQFFITLDEFGKRRDPKMHAFAVTDRAKALLEEELPEAQVSLFYPPAVSGLGSASGFKIIIEDRSSLGVEELQRQVDRICAAGNAGRFAISQKSLAELRESSKEPIPEPAYAQLAEFRDHEFLTRELCENAVADALTSAGITNHAERARLQKHILSHAENRKVVGNLFSIFRANTPQLFVDINREQCQTMGVNPNDVFNTLQIYLGSLYVNDFNRFGRTWQVIVQAEGDFRDNPEKIRQLKVRNATGGMVPLGAVVEVKAITGPINIGRYNMYPAAAILGGTKPGVSTGQGIDEMEALCNELLPQGMEFEWTEINYMQIDAANNIWNQLIFPLAVVCVFLVLAAQYESWSLPLAVILVVPMCIFASLAGVWLTKGDINIFTQIGFVVLVGLASKNAILIVEFAKHKHEEGGLDRRAATLAACRLRLRPILMTSFAFILGVVPLLVTTGAGAEMRKTLGTAVFSGMLGVTLFGIFLTPVFFYVIAGLGETSLFASPEMKRVGLVSRYVLGILALGLPWLLRGRPHPEPEAVAQEHADDLIHTAAHDRNGVNGDNKSAKPQASPEPKTRV